MPFLDATYPISEVRVNDQCGRASQRSPGFSETGSVSSSLLMATEFLEPQQVLLLWGSDTDYSPLPTAHRPLLTAHSPLSTGRCAFPTTHCPLRIAHCSLLTALTSYCSLLAAYR